MDADRRKLLELLLRDLDVPDLVLDRPAWQADGLCREHPESTWFGWLRRQDTAAKAICAGCLVRRECLDYALANDEHGVWGGTTEAERRRLRADRLVVSRTGRGRGAA